MGAPRTESSAPFVLAEATQKRLESFAYVHAVNAARYRTIARFLLHAHDRLRDWVSPEEIFESVKRWLDADYTIDLLRLDLQSMVEWQAIATDQDKTKATSLEAFYRTRLVYRLAPQTIEFERLLVKLDTPAATGGVLNATLLQRLWHAVEQLHAALEIATQSTLSAEEIRRDIVDQWDSVLATLRDLQEGARDFYQTLGTALPVDASSIGPFMIYKDALKTYLTGFLSELQEYQPRLSRRFERWRELAYPPLLTQLLARHDVENRIARLSAAGTPLTPAEIAGQVHAPALAGVMDWMAPDGGASTLVEKTKHAIIFIVNQNERLVSRHAVGNSRRRDLDRLASVFAHLVLIDAPSEVADQLWARAMGAIVPRHLRGGASEESVLAPNESVWLQTPIEYPLRTYRRGRRAQGATAKVLDRRDVLTEAKKEAELQLARERALWDRLLHDGAIDTSELTLEDEALRGPILELIARARLDADGIAMTRDGRQIRIEKLLTRTNGNASNDRLIEGEVLPSMGRILAPDGTFFLPSVRLIAIPRPGDADQSDDVLAELEGNELIAASNDDRALLPSTQPIPV